MALLETFDRGNEILFTATPLDLDGNPATPDHVELQISFMKNGERQLEVMTMEETTDGTYRYIWDSSFADRGRVHWAVRCIDPPSADEGKFNLAANLANQDPSTP